MLRIYADFDSFIREEPLNQRHQRSIKSFLEIICQFSLDINRNNFQYVYAGH